MLSKEKGLRLQICSFTGYCELSYYFPVKKEFSNQMSEVAKLHNAEVENIKGKLYIVYKDMGTSTSVISKFRIVQKQFMIHSRENKITSLQNQINFLNNKNQ